MELTVEADRTAVIVVDMWNVFPCETFGSWVDELVGRMNLALDYFRGRGIPVLFMGENVLCPYKDMYHCYGLRQHRHLGETWHAIDHPVAPGQATWWGPNCCCEEPCERKKSGWTHLHDGLVVHPRDLIGGWNMHTGFIRAHGITTLLYCGVAANICVLDSRHFSICQSLAGGMGCVLLEDLTETIVPGVPRGEALAQTFDYYNVHICPTIQTCDLRIDGDGLWHWYRGTT